MTSATSAASANNRRLTTPDAPIPNAARKPGQSVPAPPRILPLPRILPSPVPSLRAPAPPVSAPNSSSGTKISKRRPAFTLIELLVVIGIIGILIALLLPMVFRSMRQATRTRIASDLNAISSALDAYKQVFGDYPRITYVATSPYGVGSGAEVLGKALLGLGPADAGTLNTGSYSSTTPYHPGNVVLSGANQFVALKASTGVTPAASDPTATWVTVTIPPDTGGATGGGFDGADGPGFRLRSGGFGQVYGPYLQADKFKTRGLALADYNGNAILYYPANPTRPSVTTALGAGSFGAGNSYISTASNITPNSPPSAMPTNCVSYYDYSDNDTGALQSVDTNIEKTFADWRVMAAMLGDYDFTTYSGYIGSGETAASTSPFLLWSPGPDGIYGPLEASQNLNGFLASTPAQIKNYVAKCDDVTNFSFGR